MSIPLWRDEVSTHKPSGYWIAEILDSLFCTITIHTVLLYATISALQLLQYFSILYLFIVVFFINIYFLYFYTFYYLYLGITYAQHWEGSEPKNSITGSYVPLFPVYDK